MNKWKCGICNNEFDNFQAQGFGGTIYCPLCYFKDFPIKGGMSVKDIQKAMKIVKKELRKQKIRTWLKSS